MEMRTPGERPREFMPPVGRTPEKLQGYDAVPLVEAEQEDKPGGVIDMKSREVDDSVETDVVKRNPEKAEALEQLKRAADARDQALNNRRQAESILAQDSLRSELTGRRDAGLILLKAYEDAGMKGRQLEIAQDRLKAVEERLAA